MDRRDFIKVTGISGASLYGFSSLLSCVNSENRIDEEIKQQALYAFKRFEEVWDFSDFWKRGNTFDACLVFADAVQKRWPNDPEDVG